MPKSSELAFATGNEVPLLSDTIVPGQHPAVDPPFAGEMQGSWSEDQVDLMSMLQPLEGVQLEASPWDSPNPQSGVEWMSPVPRSCAHVQDLHDPTGSADIDADDGHEPLRHTTVMLEEEASTGPQVHTDSLILPHPSKARVASAAAASLMPPHGAGNREGAQAPLPSNPVDLVSALEKANRLRHRHRPQPDGMRSAAAREPASDVAAEATHQSHMAQHDASSAGTVPPEQQLRSHIESFEAGSHSESPPVEEDIDRIQDTICWMTVEDLEEPSMGHG